MVPPSPRKLVEALDEVKLTITWRRLVVDGVECRGVIHNDRDPIEIEVWITNPKHRCVGDIVVTVIHELLHHVGYTKEAHAYGMDEPYYSSRILRIAVLEKLFEIVRQRGGWRKSVQPKVEVA